MALRAESRIEECGDILVVAQKEDAFSFIKNALGRYYHRLSYTRTLTEARQKMSAEKIAMIFLVGSPSDGDGNGIKELVDIVQRRSVPAVAVVSPEVYPQIAFRVRGMRIFVLTYPMKKGFLVQAVNMMYESQIMMLKVLRDKEKLEQKLADLSALSRAKLLLIEQRGMTEDEAHHEVEKLAMDHGLTRRRAAERIIASYR